MNTKQAEKKLKSLFPNEYMSYTKTIHHNGHINYLCNGFIDNDICLVSGQQESWEDAISNLEAQIANHKQ